MSQQKERPTDSVTEAVFGTVLAAVRDTRDPNAVSAVASEPENRHRIVCVLQQLSRLAETAAGLQRSDNFHRPGRG